MAGNHEGLRCALLAYLLLSCPFLQVAGARRAQQGEELEHAGSFDLEALDEDALMDGALDETVARQYLDAQGCPTLSWRKATKTYHFDVGDPESSEGAMAIEYKRAGVKEDHDDKLVVHRNAVWTIRPDNKSSGWFSWKADKVIWEATPIEGKKVETYIVDLNDGAMIRMVDNGAVEITDACGQLTRIKDGVYYRESVMEKSLGEIDEAVEKEEEKLGQMEEEEVGDTAVSDATSTLRGYSSRGFKRGAKIGLGFHAVTLLAMSSAPTLAHSLVFLGIGTLAGGAVFGIVGTVVGIGAAVKAYRTAKKDAREHGMPADEKLFEKLRCHREVYEWCSHGEEEKAYLKAKGTCEVTAPRAECGRRRRRGGA
uniref:Uncharacterized protein n=1 Tax=Pyrodinium bahamense TaxID=73915 RepID=A0A7S0A288_9DINO